MAPQDPPSQMLRVAIFGHGACSILDRIKVITVLVVHWLAAEQPERLRIRGLGACEAQKHKHGPTHPDHVLVSELADAHSQL